MTYIVAAWSGIFAMVAFFMLESAAKAVISFGVLSGVVVGGLQGKAIRRTPDLSGGLRDALRRTRLGKASVALQHIAYGVVWLVMLGGALKHWMNLVLGCFSGALVFFAAVALMQLRAWESLARQSERKRG